jgi:hypothetical protein
VMPCECTREGEEGVDEPDISQVIFSPQIIRDERSHPHHQTRTRPQVWLL